MIRKFALTIIASFFIQNAFAQQSTILGDWYGGADVGVFLRINFHIINSENGLKATMDSPDQKAFGVPVDEVSFSGDSLRISLKRIGFNYAGVYNSSKQTITGKFSQGLVTKEMNLSRDQVAAPVPLNYFQEPKPPFSYYTEDIFINNDKDNVTLAGTFSRPNTEGKYPVVILISGSGPQDRNGTMAGHKPFLVIADYLTRQGFAVLRYDDRGYGQSTGNFVQSTIYNFANDVLSAVEYIKTRKDIDVKHIGLIGHSEGGYIAPMVAADSKDIAFIVLLAGPGTTGKEVLITQNKLLIEANNLPLERIYSETEFINRVAEVLAERQDSLSKSSLIKPLLEQRWNQLSLQEQAVWNSKETFIKTSTKTLLSPWFSAFVSFNPKPYLEKVKCPVLAMNGTKDLQVEYKSNLKGLKAELDKAGNKHCTYAAMEGLNHLFQTADKGTVNEYTTIKETFSPKALQLIADWLNDRIKNE